MIAALSRLCSLVVPRTRSSVQALASARSGLRWVGLGCLAVAGSSSAATWDDEAGDNLWTSLANWSDNATQAAQAVVFDTAGNAGTAGTVTSIMDASGTFTISSLRFQQNGAALFHTLQINAGNTLVVNGTNSLKVGVGSYNASNIGTNDNTRTQVTITGGGALQVNNTGGNFEVGMPTAADAALNQTTLDMTGLTSFTANVNELRVAWGKLNQATLNLSNTANDITANTIQISNTGGQNAAAGVMVLGNGTNVIRATTINLGISKGDATLRFASQTAGSPGTVTIGGKTAGTAANFVLASASDSTAANLVGLLDLRGHVATVTAGDIVMGRRSGNGGNGATGTISFDNGTFTVNNLSMGIRQQDAAGTGGKASGILNVSGGTFTVNAGGSFILGTRTGTTGTATAEGIVNLSGGTLISNVDISHGGGVGASSIINVTGGTLDMKGRNIGDATNRITTLNFKSGRLQNFGEVNGGQTGLNITAVVGDVLVLEGVNTYTGGTSVAAGGRLQVGSGSLTGVLGAGQVTLGSGASLAFNRSNSTTVSNAITGADGKLEQMGTGRTILTGTNTYTGTTTVKAGVLQANSGSALGQSSRLIVEAGGAFHFVTGSGGTMNLAQGSSQNLDLRDGSFVGVEVGGTVNSGAVGALTAGNVGLRLFANSSLGSLPASTTLLQASGGGLNGANYSLRVYNNSNFTATLNAKTDTAITANLTAATALTQAWWVGGRVTGNSGEWAVSTGATSNWGADATGAATALVPGAATDVFISATGGDATSMSLGADMSVGSITVQSTGAANLTDARYQLSLTKSNAITTNAGAGATNLAVRLNLANAAPVITVNSTTALTLSGVLTGSAGFTKAGTGALILSGAEANEYTGAVAVIAGTVELSKTAGMNAITGNLSAGDGSGTDRVLWRASDQIADTSIVTLNTGGLLSLNGFNETIGGLNGVGTVENISGSVASVLTVGFGGANSTFEGLLRNGGTATLGLTKTGAGTLTLTGTTANTNTGLTTVLGGVLALNKTAGTNAIGGALTINGGTAQLLASDQIVNTGAVTITGGGVLALGAFNDSVGAVTLDNGDITGTGMLTAGGAYTVRNGNISANLAGASGFRKEGTGTVSVSGTNTFTGLVKVDQGVLKVLSDKALGSVANTVELSGDSAQSRNPTLWFEGGVNVTIAAMRTSGAGNSGATAGVLYNASGVNTLNVTGDISLTAGNGGSTYFSQAGTLIINAARLRAQDTSRTLALDGPGNGVINAVIENGATVALPLTKSGSGTWVLTGANTYTGATAVTAGTLKVTNKNGLSGTSRLTVSGGATFHYQSGALGNNLTVAGLTLANNSRIGAELGNSIVVGAGGATTTGATVTLDLFGISGNSYAAGAYNVITAGSGLNAGTYNLGLVYNMTGFKVDTAQGTNGISKTDTAVTVYLAAAAELVTAYWKGGFTGGGGALGHVWAVSNGTTQSNWVTDVGADTPLVPGANTNVIFSASGATNQNVPMVLGANMSIGSLTFNDATPATLSDGTNQLRINGQNAITVNGAGPVVLNTNLVLAHAAPVLNVGAGGTLTLGLSVSGANVTKTGSGTLTFSGSHASTFSGLFTVSGGTLLLGKADGVASISDDLRIQSGGTVRLLNGNQIADAADVTVEAGGQLDLNGKAESIDGLNGDGTVTNGGVAATTMVLGAGNEDGSFSGVIADGTGGMSLTKTGTGAQTLAGASTYSGLTTVLNGTLRFGGNNVLGAGDVLVNGATAVLDVNAYTDTVGKVTLTNGSITGTAASLLTSTTSFELLNGLVSARLAGNVAVNKTTAGTVTMSGQSIYGGGTNIKQGTLVVAGVNALPTTGAVVVGDAANVGILQVNEDQTIASLRFRSNTATSNTVTIAAGKTLTVNGAESLKVGIGSGTVADPYINTSTTKATINGAGSLVVNNSTGTFSVGIQNVDQNNGENTSELDLRDLGSFSATVGTLRVGYESRNNSVFRLSNTSNTIIANLVTIGNSNGNNAGTNAQMYLGAGVNIIQTNTLDIGRGKTPNALLTFGSASGTAVIEGRVSGSSVNINVGVATEVDTGATIGGTLNLAGHYVTVYANELNIGRRTRASTGGATGTVSFSQGEFFANLVNIASRTAGGNVSGQLNVSGGEFTVYAFGDNSIILASGDSTNGHLNLTGGVFNSWVKIQDGGGSGLSRITLDGGTLDMHNNVIGDHVNVINELNLISGVLKNVDSINTNAGITKTGAGKTLKLEGSNYFYGDSAVSAGTLLVNGTHGDAGESYYRKAGSYNVASGAVLGGTGGIHLDEGKSITIQSGGKLAVGDSTLGSAQAGTLTVSTMGSGALVFESGSSLEFDLTTAGTGGLNEGDALDLDGQLFLGSGATLNIANANGIASWAYGDTWKLFDWAGVTFAEGSQQEFTIGSSFDAVLQGSGYFWDLSKLYTDGTITVVPEPGRMVLLLLGFSFMLVRRRRK